MKKSTSTIDLLTRAADESRSALIAAFKNSDHVHLYAAPETDDITHDTVNEGDDASSDDPVTTAVTALAAQLDEVKKAQAVDPDAAEDPNDAAVAKLLDQLTPLMAQLVEAQAKDDAADKPAPAKPDAKPTAKPTGQDTAGDAPSGKMAAGPDSSQTDSGDITDPDAKCAVQGCAHPASSHADTEQGAMTGACSECSLCNGFVDGSSVGTPSDPEGDDADGSGDGTNGGGAHVLHGAEFVDGVGPIAAPGDDPAAPSPADALEKSPNVPPFVPGSSMMGPQFTIPVAIVEGAPTDDGREVALDALEWGPPPYALMGLSTSTHDPMGMDQNDPAVLIGRIDSFERVSGENGTQVIVGKGYFLENDDAAYFADLLNQMGRLPVSADVSVLEQEVEVGETDEFGWPMEMSQTLTKGVMQAVTVLPHSPAFSSAYIVLGDGTGNPEPVEQAAEPVVASAQRIHWMSSLDEGSCLPCMCGTDALVASGGPARPPATWFEDPHFAEGDGRLMDIIGLGEYGQMVQGRACPLTITDDGRIYGHIAPWGMCHIGFQGECILPPRSESDYAHFKRGHILSAEGERIRVGILTAGVGHAGLRDSVGQVIDHYDNTALQAAYVNSGEDEYGIWVAGTVAPDATEEQIQKLRVSGVSGDWRNDELRAALSVNVPGFPMALTAAGGRRVAILGAGSTVMYRMTHKAAPLAATPPIEPTGDLMLRAALAPFLTASKDLARREHYEIMKLEARRRYEEMKG